MPYSSEVRVSEISGAPTSLNVNLTLWELFSTIGNAGRFRDNQVDQETITVAVSGGVPIPFSTVTGPSNLMNRSHSIALAAYQTGMPGPMFRSSRLGTLPPGSPGNPSALVDIMLTGPQRVTMGQINGMIPTPITLEDGNTVQSVTITSAPPSRDLTLVATGPYGTATYTYTLTFTIDPSNDQNDLSSVLEVNPVGLGSLTFTAGPGGGFQAFLDNLFAGLAIGQITYNVLKTIMRIINATAVQEGAKAAAAAGICSGLPAGVVLGIRSVGVASNGDLVFLPAIGSFGSLVTIFLNAPPAAVGVGDHFYTVDTNERDNAITAFCYSSEGIACYVFIAAPSGTTPLYRLYNPGNGDHFYTTSLAERDNAIANYGYTEEGIASYVFATQSAGTTPLFRLANPGTGDHFYTTNPDESKNAIANYGYTQEGIASYVFATQSAGTTPLFRLANPGTGDHFYTTNPDESKNAVAYSGYTDEGIACYVFMSEPLGTTPLYRLLNPGNGDHFYTTSLAERDNAIANVGYSSEDIACYVFTAKSAGTTPLFRLYNPGNGDHFYTIDANELVIAVNNSGYTDEGVACFVFASQVTGTTPLFRLVLA